MWFVLRTPLAVPTLVPLRTAMPFDRALPEPEPVPETIAVAVAAAA